MAFTPLLLDKYISPMEAWPLLCTAESDANLLAACRPLWDWLCTVGVTNNSNLRINILLLVAGKLAFCAARACVQQLLLGSAHAPTSTPVTPTHSPGRDAPTITRIELTKSPRNFTSGAAKTAQTVEMHWPYQVDKILRLCKQTDLSALPPVWHALAKEKHGTPARICIQVACNAGPRSHRQHDGAAYTCRHSDVESLDH